MDRNAADWLNAGSLSRSLSARRAWIEIFWSGGIENLSRSLSARRAWIEISTVIVILRNTNTSLSARRAWIEMIDYIIDYVNDAVALRKESVDRNCLSRHMDGVHPVALRKESVDRNTTLHNILELLTKSLSARRAWIEMLLLFWSILR